jgi:hypothetical protein
MLATATGQRLILDRRGKCDWVADGEQLRKFRGHAAAQPQRTGRGRKRQVQNEGNSRHEIIIAPRSARVNLEAEIDPLACPGESGKMLSRSSPRVIPRIPGFEGSPQCMKRNADA